MKFRSYIGIYSLIACLVPLLLAIILSIWIAVSDTVNTTLNSIQAELKAISGELDGFFHARESEIALLARQPQLISKPFEESLPYLKNELSQSGSGYEKFIIGKKSGHFLNTSGGNPGQGMMRTFNDADPDAKPKNIRKRDYWQVTVGNNQDGKPLVYTSNPMISYTTGVRQIVVASSINNDHGELKGLLGGSLPWELIETKLDTIKVQLEEQYPSMHFALVAKDGSYWYHWDENKVIRVRRNSQGNIIKTDGGEQASTKTSILEEPDIELRKLGAAALTGLTGVKKLHNDFDQGIDYYVYAPIPSIGYSLILAIDEAEVLAPVERVMRLMLIVLITSILFLFILVYMLSKKLSLPVANMSEAIRHFDPEGKDTIALESNIDEFRELIKSFESKADNVMQSAQSKNKQLKQAVDQLSIEKQAAEQANRAKSDFLANMSHEIRTPMNAINGMADLCLLTNLNDTQKRYLTKLKSAGGALLGLLNDILDFSKIEAGKLEIEKTRFDLTELLSNIANIVSITAEEKGIEFIIHTDITIPNVLIGDPLRVNQILINLCSNAVKFTDKGEVRLDVTLSRHEANNVELKFSVKDSGIGIPEEKLSHLFEEFYQTDSSSTRKYGGTGLGLAISQKLTNIMKGNMSVSSHYGKGSTFVADIPFGVKDSCVDYTKHSVQLNGKRILVVDDNASVREIYCAMLRHFNCEVDSAINGQTAIDKCLSQQYDLLILD